MGVLAHHFVHGFEQPIGMRGVHREVASLAVDFEHQVWQGGQGGLQAFFALGQFDGGGFLFGDVHADAPVTKEMAVLVKAGLAADDDPAGLAVGVGGLEREAFEG